MNIFYLSSSTITSQKANSVQVMKICDAFSELGHNVVLFARKNNKDFNNDSNDIKKYYGIKNNIVVHLIKSSSIRFIGGLEYGHKVLKIIKALKIKPDLLYGRNLYALINCLHLNKPIIYESHTAPGIGKKTLEYYLFSKPQFKKLIVINQALFNYYKNNFKIFKKYPEKLCLAPDGAVINYNLINNNTNKTPVIGYAGSLYPGKGIETIIEIAKIMPEYIFKVAGGTQEQIKTFKRIKSDNVVLTGYITPSNIPEFLSGCNILLAPYSKEVYTENYKKNNIVNWMSPLKIFEYMASKKPIVASNLPAIKEILEDNKTALLVDYDSILDWKKAIVKLLCKPDFTKNLSENAFNEFLDKYTWSKRAEKVLENVQTKRLINSKSTTIKTIKQNSSKNTTHKNVISLENKINNQQTKLFSNDSLKEAKISYINNIDKPVILHIIGDLNVGGAERTISKIVPKLNNNQYTHKILTLFELGVLAKDLQKKGIEVKTLHLPRTILCLKSFLRIIKVIKSINPIIIQTWLYHSNNIINLVSPFINNIKIINNIRHDNTYEGSIKTKLSANFGAFISKIVDKPIVFCSESSKNTHLKKGYSNKNTVIIENGFVIPEINKKELKHKLKTKLNIPSDYKVAINVGRYCPEKDYPTLFKAIQILSKKYSKIIFVICGKGLEKSNKELSTLSEKLGIENNIFLLGHKSNIEDYIAGSDFLVSSSNSESFPNVIAEAMSLSTPCIATNTGDTANMIGDTGIIVEPKKPSDLANAMYNFLQFSENTINTLSNKAKERIRLKYTLEICVAKYSDLYKRILSDNSI